MKGWRVGELKGWRVGELEGWRVGELEGWRVKSIKIAQMKSWIFRRTLWKTRFYTSYPFQVFKNKLKKQKHMCTNSMKGFY